MRYRIRKLVGLVGYSAVFLFLAVLFEDRLRQASFALSVLGAGIVVALQDGIASIGGWFAISFSSLYRVGDRIQVGETKGDVIDISLLRTTIMETGNWVSGDLYNGRVVAFPTTRF
jgi:small-conductance mechanosensitive channel